MKRMRQDEKSDSLPSGKWESLFLQTSEARETSCKPTGQLGTRSSPEDGSAEGSFPESEW